MKSFLSYFFTGFWWVWILMLIIGDPIASWLGKKYGVGDQYTDTHLLVRYVSISLRAGILGWVNWHFLVAHIRS